MIRTQYVHEAAPRHQMSQTSAEPHANVPTLFVRVEGAAELIAFTREGAAGLACCALNCFDEQHEKIELRQINSRTSCRQAVPLREAEAPESAL